MMWFARRRRAVAAPHTATHDAQVLFRTQPEGGAEIYDHAIGVFSAVGESTTTAGSVHRARCSPSDGACAGRPKQPVE
jgi:hypothetical protein